MNGDNKNTAERFVFSKCGAVLTRETMYEFEGQVFCEKCFDTQTTVCGCCSRRIFTDDSRTFDGQIMCEACLDEQTNVCEECGRRIWNDDTCGNSDIVLCGHCEDHYYTNCEECGRLIHRDDANYDDDECVYCDSCYEKLKEKAIQCYNYKPEPIFYGSGDLFMGVELEIDKGGNDDENAKTLLDIANWYCDWRYCRTDNDDYCQMHIADLKSVASGLGYSSDDVDELLNEGFMPDEIEEYLYYI